MKRCEKMVLVCIAFAAVQFAAGSKGVLAYTISGSEWASRDHVTSEWGTSDAEARWQGSDGADLEAYAWDANSGCYASAMWTYNLGYSSGSLTITWSYHINAYFTVNGAGVAYCAFWFELWGSSGRIGSSSTKVHQDDIDADRTIDKTFSNLAWDSYRVVVYALARAESDTDGSSAEADAYYGSLQVTTNWLEIS